MLYIINLYPGFGKYLKYLRRFISNTGMSEGRYLITHWGKQCKKLF